MLSHCTPLAFQTFKTHHYHKILFHKRFSCTITIKNRCNIVAFHFIRLFEYQLLFYFTLHMKLHCSQSVFYVAVALRDQV